MVSQAPGSYHCTSSLALHVRQCYAEFVTSTITQFRKELFQLADRAIRGENVQFTYRGVVFKVTPEKKQSKLEKLVGQPVLAEGVDIEQAGKELMAGMEAEWTDDWNKL
jgi:hypothetical protein